MLKEEFLHSLLQAAYEKGELNIYDHTEHLSHQDPNLFGQCRLWAHQLVRDKLASYQDPEHTIITLTNYGKFWILRGGYTSFLSDEHILKEKLPIDKSQQKVELLEARLKLTHYRLVGFWITLVISLIGFLLSIFNLYLYFSKK